MDVPMSNRLSVFCGPATIQMQGASLVSKFSINFDTEEETAVKFWNSGKGESNILQNQFTRYLKTSIQRKKVDLFRVRSKVYDHECFDDSWQDIPGLITVDVYFNSPTQFDTIGLEQILRQIEKRDRYIFYAHVLDERTLTELAAELGLTYKGVTAAYYRVIHKIRDALRGDEYEF